MRVAVTRDGCALGMGKMILFRELVLSVQFTITIRLFDSFVTSDYILKKINNKKTFFYNFFFFLIGRGPG